MKKKSVSIYCDEIIAYGTLISIVDRYQKKNYEIKIYTRHSNINIAKKIFERQTVISCKKIDQTYRFLLYNFFLLFLTDPKFSKLFARTQIHKFGRFLFKTSKILSLYRYIKSSEDLFLRFFSSKKEIFDTDLVISISRVSRPYLFTSCSKKHITVVESWDHINKSPWFISPRYTLCWNLEQKKLIKRYQSFNKISYIKPSKYNYLYFEAGHRLPSYMESKITIHYSRDRQFIDRNKGKFVMYSMAFSEQNTLPFSGEIKLIYDLSIACMEKGLILFVKPKPLYKPSNQLLQNSLADLPNCFVGSAPLYDLGIDLISASYNNLRKEMLFNTYLLVDIGSSFLIDAAFSPSPAVRISVQSSNYSNLDEISNTNTHLMPLQKKSFFYNGHCSEFSFLFENISKFDISIFLKNYLTNKS